MVAPHPPSPVPSVLALPPWSWLRSSLFSQPLLPQHRSHFSFLSLNFVSAPLVSATSGDGDCMCCCCGGIHTHCGTVPLRLIIHKADCRKQLRKPRKHPTVETAAQVLAYQAPGAWSGHPASFAAAVAEGDGLPMAGADLFPLLNITGSGLGCGYWPFWPV